MTQAKELRTTDIKTLYSIRVARGCYVRDMKAQGLKPDPELLKEFDDLVEYFSGLVSKK